MLGLVLMATAGLAIGNPMTWITNDDYPRLAWEQHHDGAVLIEFFYDQSGRIFACQVLSSSGWPELDQQTCATIAGRGRIKPSRDDAGESIGTRSTLRFNWVLPDRPPKPLAPLPPDLEIDVAALPRDTKRPIVDLISVIAEDGRVESCALAEKQGTGSKALDQAACRTLKDNTFAAVRDPSGKPMRYLRFVKVGFAVSPK